MKDDWPIATRLSDPVAPMGWKQYLSLLVVTVLVCGFFAVVGGESSFEVVRDKTERISGD